MHKTTCWKTDLRTSLAQFLHVAAMDLLLIISATDFSRLLATKRLNQTRKLLATVRLFTAARWDAADSRWARLT